MLILEILSFSTGLIIIAVIFHFLLNYDFILRYQTAMTNHSRIMNFQPNIQFLTQALLLNNTEFATWIGLPIALLFLAQIPLVGVRFIHRKVTSLTVLMVAFSITYFLLNLMGQTRGEVGRLWLFLVPIICLFGAETAQIDRSRSVIMACYLMTLQLITAFFILIYQS